MLQRAVLGETDDSTRQVAVSSPASGDGMIHPEVDIEYQRVSGDQAIDYTGQDLRDPESTADETVHSGVKMAALMDSKNQPGLADSTVLGGSLPEDEVECEI